MRRPYNTRFVSIPKNESHPSRRPFSVVRPFAPLTGPQAQEGEAEQRATGDTGWTDAQQGAAGPSPWFGRGAERLGPALDRFAPRAGPSTGGSG